MIATHTPAIAGFAMRDGIYFPAEGYSPQALAQKHLWDKLGKTYYDSAKIEQLEISPELRQDHTILAGKLGPFWQDFPEFLQVENLLDIGTGYGLLPLRLSKEKSLRCDRFFGIDISESLLRRLQTFKAVYDFLPGSDFSLFCASAETLPIPDQSMDLVLSNCVFMHLTEGQVKAVLAEVRRVLKPGGAFVFHHSFHNRRCPAHQVANGLRRLLGRHLNPLYLRQYSASEIDGLIQASGLAAVCPRYRVAPTTEYALLPRHLRGRPVPLAATINGWVRRPPRAWRDRLAYGYSAYSEPLGQPQRWEASG